MTPTDKPTEVFQSPVEPAAVVGGSSDLLEIGRVAGDALRVRSASPCGDGSATNNLGRATVIRKAAEPLGQQVKCWRLLLVLSWTQCGHGPPPIVHSLAPE
jgi:hypothetical protein